MEHNINQANAGEIIIYQTPDGKASVNVKLQNETLWLTQDQIGALFKKDKSDISRHINNIFEEGELDRETTVAKIATVVQRGFRGPIEDYITYYNLDVIISVGYRVKSKDATAFRIWATSVLKEYLIKGYAINPRFEQLERRVAKTEEKIDYLVRTSLPPVEGIFFDGQIYDAYEFISGLIKSAKVRIILIDNHIGASLKDLGKKWFAFSLMNDLTPEGLISRL